jgi:hypothetical protein
VNLWATMMAKGISILREEASSIRLIVFANPAADLSGVTISKV